MEIGLWMLKDGAIGAAVIVALFFIFRVIFYRASKNRKVTGKDPARIRAIFSMLILFWLAFTFIMVAFGGFGLFAVGFILTSLLLVFLIILTPDKFLYYPVITITVIDIGQTLMAVFAGHFNLLDLLLLLVRVSLLVAAMLLNHRAVARGTVRLWGKTKINILRGVSTVLTASVLIIVIIDVIFFNGVL